ncbi:hypothetical protein [Planococcus sp. NCCP-2050]|uniref:hypothetical protein n=1 Tax=Planococcus sp. NCCP-2050 TaxID=2944679 RepID=UPI00203CD09A|nr:hypothetical protein [Planococcus sp. NCCP-2050]GKW45314.1 hypothetical protein NCCP2050_10060 [Planococcus sp. NCCP-2050]
MGQQVRHSLKLAGLMMLCLMVSACNPNKPKEPEPKAASGSDRCEAAVSEVVGSELTGPDKEVSRMKQEVDDMLEEFDEKYGHLVQHPGYMQSGPEIDAFFAYARETYRSYFTEKGYVEFINRDFPDVFKFHQHNLDYWMDAAVYVEKVEIEDTDQEFSAFDFTAEVEYSTRREGGSYDFTGWALCTPDGVISHLTMIDLDGLAARIESDL